MPSSLTLEQTVAMISRLDRRRREYRDVGWVYILRNQAYRDTIIKIGKSSRYPTWRAAELTKATGVVGVFDAVYFVHVHNIHAAEHHAHVQLRNYRLEAGKEFFNAPLRLAVEALDEAAELYPVALRVRNGVTVIAQCFPEHVIPCFSCKQVNRFKQLYVDVNVRCSKCGTALPTPPPEKPDSDAR